MLSLDPSPDVHTQKHSQITVGDGFELRLPAEPRGRHSEAPDRVTGVVMAITESWSLFRRGLLGSYHEVSVKHSRRYLNEFV